MKPYKDDILQDVILFYEVDKEFKISIGTDNTGKSKILNAVQLKGLFSL